MRKLIFVTLLLSSILSVSAQGNINKGDWMVGGAGSVTAYKTGGYKETDLQLSPDFGYFVITRLAVGLRTDLVYVKWPGGAKSSNLSAGPFVRYYFLSPAQKVNVFADGGFALGEGKQKNPGLTSSINYTVYSVKLGPAIFLTPAVAFEIALGYTSENSKNYNDPRTNLALTFGFQVHLPGKDKK